MSEIRKTIGLIKCPIAGDMAEVREDKKKKLYYVGKAGMIKPNNADGQAWLRENYEPFPDEVIEKVNSTEPQYGRRSVGAFLETLEFQKPVERKENSVLTPPDKDKTIAPERKKSGWSPLI